MIGNEGFTHRSGATQVETLVLSLRLISRLTPSSVATVSAIPHRVSLTVQLTIKFIP